MKTIELTVSARTDLEVRQLKSSLEALTKLFKPDELQKISKKLENPAVLLKIRSMI